MSSESRGPAWVPGKRPRGDSPATCLVIIIAMIVGSVWGYYKFLHNRSLEKAGEEIVVLSGDDPSAVNAYKLRMRDTLLPSLKMLGSEVNGFVLEVVGGKRKNATEINDKITDLENRLREEIGEVNGQGCPKQFSSTHKLMAQSVGAFWRSLVALRDGVGEEDAKAKTRLFTEAKNLAGKGMKNFNMAESNIQAALR